MCTMKNGEIIIIEKLQKLGVIKPYDKDDRRYKVAVSNYSHSYNNIIKLMNISIEEVYKLQEIKLNEEETIVIEKRLCNKNIADIADEIIHYRFFISNLSLDELLREKDKFDYFLQNENYPHAIKYNAIITELNDRN